MVSAKQIIKIQEADPYHGYVSLNGETTMTFEIIKGSDQQNIDSDSTDLTEFYSYSRFFKFSDYVIAANGSNNNLPGDVSELIRKNHLLPEILKKQVRFLYGHGPFLYVEEWDQNNHLIRKPVGDKYPDVLNWLASWRKNGIKQDANSYFKKMIFEYYYNEGLFSKYIFNISRRIGRNIPIRGLEYVSSVKARLAKAGTVKDREKLHDSDLDLVILNNWDNPYRFNASEYPRFDPADPFRYPVAINYVADKGFDEEIYAVPTFYYGLKEWIKGSNLNPKYVNSYLKNSLSAKIHVIIPDSWIQQKIKTLKDIVEANKNREQAGEDLETSYDGLTGIGTTFNYGMVQSLIKVKLRKLTEVLAGEGENQGKTFVTRSFRTEYGIENWEFKEIPMKYKEYISSIIEFDKRAVEVILQGKGIDPSISNVSKDGIFQSSGSQVYYNYMIYLNSLTYAEEFITDDVNNALRINFPKLAKANVKLGFYRNVPERIQEISPENRLQNQVN